MDIYISRKQKLHKEKRQTKRDLKNIQEAFLVYLLVILISAPLSFYLTKSAFLTMPTVYSHEYVMPEPERKPDAVVYVCGAVATPGVLKIDADSQLIDAINVAGGLMANADTSTINLKQTVEDGMKIFVPVSKGKEIKEKDKSNLGGKR